MHGRIEESKWQNLKPSAHQVAGHRFEEGRQGALVDDCGRFYKPVQGDGRGEAETEFYRTIWSDPDIPPAISKFFPRFYGVQDVTEVAHQDLCSHVILEDVTHGYRQPCILDLKIGKRTWHEGQSEEYKQKCQSKDAATTSASLGYRLAGMQVFDCEAGRMWKANRRCCKTLSAATMPAALTHFISGKLAEEPPLADDQSMAAEVLEGSVGLIAQLIELRLWFAAQCKYHFYSASLLFVYEGAILSEDEKGGDVSARALRRPKSWMIDFAHVVYGNDFVDTNFIEGLDSVIEALTMELKVSRLTKRLN